MFTRARIAPLGCFRFAVLLDRVAYAPALVYTGTLEECRTALATLTAGMDRNFAPHTATDAPATSQAA